MRFNTSNSTSTISETRNYEGGIAYKLDDHTELYQRIATCLVGEPKFYDSNDGNDTLQAIISLVEKLSKTDPEYVLKLAVHAKDKLFLRSAPILLLGESVLNEGTRKYVRKYTPQIIARADGMLEILAYLQNKLGDFGNRKETGMLPASIKKGLADTIGKFDEYQLQKHDSRSGKVKMKDVLNLVHPIPENYQQANLWKKVLEDRLTVANTWETYISANGSTKESWETIIPKMPYMALLRNIRNFLDKDVSNISYVIDVLGDSERIKKSKQFPFRFYSAYRSIENHDNSKTKYLLDVLEKAMDISIENLPVLTGTTAIFIDVSGSMSDAISYKSTVNRVDISCLLGAIVDRISLESVTAVFSDRVERVNLSSRNGILNNTNILLQHNHRGGTTTHRCFDLLNQRVDRIIILTDEQNYSYSYYYTRDSDLRSAFHHYKSRVNANPYLYHIDLAGYGTSSIPQDEPKTCLIAGWTDRILEYINLFEEDKKTVVDRIKNS